MSAANIHARHGYSFQYIQRVNIHTPACLVTRLPHLISSTIWNRLLTLLNCHLFSVNHRDSAAIHRFFCDGTALNRVIRRNRKHQIHHGLFHNRTQSSGSCLAGNGLIRNGFHRIICKLQIHAIQFKQLLILAGRWSSSAPAEYGPYHLCSVDPEIQRSAHDP